MLVNKHNCRYWSDENLHFYKRHHTQKLVTSNVWADIFGNHIIGSTSIPGNLNKGLGLDLLENTVDPKIIQALGKGDNFLEGELFY